jgi:hypothetical protein
VRVATFNINNINKRLDNLLAWLSKAEPDVVSLQELKAEQGAFPVNALRTLGYEAVWQGERSCNVTSRARVNSEMRMFKRFLRPCGAPLWVTMTTPPLANQEYPCPWAMVSSSLPSVVSCSCRPIRLRKAAASMYSIPIGILCSCPNCNRASIMFRSRILNELTGRDGISEP